MNLRSRFSFLFLALLGGLVLALYGIHRLQARHQSEIAQSEMQQRETLLRELIKLETDAARHFANDNAQWDDMVAFVAKPREKWAKTNIGDSLEELKINCAWILNPAGEVLYSACWPEGDSELSPLSDLKGLPALLRRPTLDAFVIKNGKVYEVYGASIVPSNDNDRTTLPAGHLLVAKEWDRTRLAALEPITQGPLTLSPKPDRASLPADLTAIPLVGINGTPVAWLGLQYIPPELESIEAHEFYELLSVAAIGMVGLIIYWCCLNRWVLHPLGLIRDSMTRDDNGVLTPLQAKGDEIGRLARLVGDSRAQRVRLREEFDTRVRMSRDLHDGSIQKIYSFGMNTASARNLLRSDPAAADQMLGHSLRVVNEVIGELRSFIHRLEPEPAPQRRMSDVFRALLATTAQKIRAEISINDVLADQLETRPRTHLMFFASEAISNVLRHAQAKVIRVAFQAEDLGARLEISDDGVGFDPANVPGGRQGQQNLAARARELGATLQIQSAPGHGTTIVLHLPPGSLGPV